MTVWACARQGEPTTYHDSEREAESHKRLVEADGKGRAAVYPVEVEGAQDAATLALRGQSGANGAERHPGATEGIRELETATDVVAREGAA